jgi:hypothetical protein
MAGKRRLFSEKTPLGYRIVLTRDRWREIIRFKHPALAGHETDVRQAVRRPDVVRASAKDANVHLYYRKVEAGYVCVVAGSDDPGPHFVVTAYFTKIIKQGAELWIK